MNKKNKQLKSSVERLKVEVNNFIDFYEQEYDFNRMIYQFWNAKDILGHITYWHESFARNVSDLANDLKPNPLKGKLSEVNKTSVETTKNESIRSLIDRLKDAQGTIEKFIFDEKITRIPYKKGSRDYSPEEHLEIVAHHIHKHLIDLRQKYDTTKEQNRIT